MELKKWLRERMVVNMRKVITIEEKRVQRMGWWGGLRIGPAIWWSVWSTGARTPSHRRRLGTTRTS